jgi:hypothetical protein
MQELAEHSENEFLLIDIQAERFLSATVAEHDELRIYSGAQG